MGVNIRFFWCITHLCHGKLHAWMFQSSDLLWTSLLMQMPFWFAGS